MQDFLFLKLGKTFSKLSFSDIMYAEAVKKYVRIVTPKKAHLILSSMCLVEKVLPPNQFCRIHRSYIISFSYMTGFDNEVAYINDKIFPIGKQHKGILQERLIILSSEAKTDYLDNSSRMTSIIRTINA
jgi:hypothetical protein